MYVSYYVHNDVHIQYNMIKLNINSRVVQSKTVDTGPSKREP